MDEIAKLQNILPIVRRSIGWSAEKLGKRIGVTRQTINNIEKNRNILTKTQYIAIRTVLDAEIEKYPEETEMLKFLLDAFIDNPDSYNKNEKEEILEQIDQVSASIVYGNTSRKKVDSNLVKTILKIGLITLTTVTAASISNYKTKKWLDKILK
ncbi:MAG: helix-turn-helix transcriptional regulator [Eubacterium sp.]|nr:helix-turn-helix transcriptional regulator [Eubacterium sp.]